MGRDLYIGDNSNLGTNNMNHTEVLTNAINILRDRDTKYGPVQEMFERTAKLASIILDRDVTPYEITVIMKCLKDARKKYDPINVDHYADNINYEAFSYQFATASTDQAAEDAVMSELAKKLAPMMPNSGEYNV